ncbi:MAG: ATP-binding protein [Elusimicrobiota bacterium]
MKRSYHDFERFTMGQMDHIESKVTSHLKEVENDVAYLASRPAVKQADTTITSYTDRESDKGSFIMRPSHAEGKELQLYSIYKRFADTHPDSRYVYMGLEEDGSYVQWPEGPTNEKYDPRIRPWYKKAMANPGKTVRTEPYAFEVDDIVIVSTVKTIQDKDGEIIGVQGICRSLDFLSSMIQEAEPGETGFVIIAEEDGTVVAHSKNPDYNFRPIKEFNSSLANSIDSGKEIFDITIDETPYSAFLKKSDFTGWYFIGLVEQSELSASARQTANHTLWIFAIISIFFAGLSILISNTLTKPIFAVVKQMAEIGEGNFDKKIPDKYCDRSDEIGILARSGESMRYKLKEMVKNLKEVREELMEKERLAAVGEMANVIGHDIRNPLSAIKNSAYYMKSVIEGKERFVNIVEIIEREIDHISKIIEDLLGYSRQRPPALSAVDVNELILEVISIIEPPENVKIETDLKEGLGTHNLDRGEVRQVLVNLINNAVQACRENKKGLVKVISERLPGDKLQIRIKDNGCGIPEEKLDKIFDAFFSTKEGGTGLGMSSAKNITERHNGKIEIDSQVGEGTEIILTIPNKEIKKDRS